MSSSASVLLDTAIRDGRVFIGLGALNISAVLVALAFNIESYTLGLGLYFLLGVSLLVVGVARFRRVR